MKMPMGTSQQAHIMGISRSSGGGRSLCWVSYFKHDRMYCLLTKGETTTPPRMPTAMGMNIRPVLPVDHPLSSVKTTGYLEHRVSRASQRRIIGSSGDLRDEEHVQQAVKDGGVQRHERHDGFCDQELQRSNQVDFEKLRKGDPLDLCLGCIGLVPGVFSALFGQLFQYGRCVGLRGEEDHSDEKNAAQDESQPIQPPPAKGLIHKTANKRT